MRRLAVVGVAIMVSGIAVGLCFVGPRKVARTPRKVSLLLWSRDQRCGLRQSVRSMWDVRKHMVWFRPSVRLTRREGPFGLFETSIGAVWAPLDERDLWAPVAEQELGLYGTGCSGVRQGDIVLDCGANVGMFTRTALRAGAACVVAIDPAPTAIECLKKTFSEEITHGRVVVYQKGVWDKDEWLSMFQEPRMLAGSSVVLKEGRVQRAQRVPLTTIDKLVAELRLPRVDFIAMDIEGAELAALTGAQLTLRRFKPRLAISAYHKQDDIARIPEVILRWVPAYSCSASLCVEEFGRIRPKVLLFH